MQRKFPTLCVGNLGVGADMIGIWQLLRSKEESGKWNHHFKGALKSTIAGRQYTQSRCHTAGFAKHNKCLVCVYNLVLQEMLARRTPGSVTDPRRLPKTTRDELITTAADPPEAILQRCQVGNLHHRTWTCGHSDTQRGRWGQRLDRRRRGQHGRQRPTWRQRALPGTKGGCASPAHRRNLRVDLAAT